MLRRNRFLWRNCTETIKMVAYCFTNQSSVIVPSSGFCFLRGNISKIQPGVYQPAFVPRLLLLVLWLITSKNIVKSYCYFHLDFRAVLNFWLRGPRVVGPIFLPINIERKKDFQSFLTVFFKFRFAFSFFAFVFLLQIFYKIYFRIV